MNALTRKRPQQPDLIGEFNGFDVGKRSVVVTGLRQPAETGLPVKVASASQTDDAPIGPPCSTTNTDELIHLWRSESNSKKNRRGGGGDWLLFEE